MATTKCINELTLDTEFNTPSQTKLSAALNPIHLRLGLCGLERMDETAPKWLMSDVLEFLFRPNWGWDDGAWEWARYLRQWTCATSLWRRRQTGTYMLNKSELSVVQWNFQQFIHQCDKTQDGIDDTPLRWPTIFSKLRHCVQMKVWSLDIKIQRFGPKA